MELKDDETSIDLDTPSSVIRDYNGMVPGSCTVFKSVNLRMKDYDSSRFFLWFSVDLK